MPVEIAGVKFPRVHRIVTSEQAAFVHHRVPGFEGSVTQNLGRDSVRLRIDGIFFGAGAKDSLEKLRNIQVKRAPVDFIADIMGSAYAARVTLDHLEVGQEAGKPDQFSYSLTLSEYVEPPKASVPATDKIQLNAKARLDLVGLPDALSLGSLPEITNPFIPLKGALDAVKEAGDGLLQSAEGLKKLFGV
jgi:hypothetical protein